MLERDEKMWKDFLRISAFIFLSNNPLVMIHKITWWKDVAVLVSILGTGSSLRCLSSALERCVDRSLQEHSDQSCTCLVYILQRNSPRPLALLTRREEQDSLQLQLSVSSQAHYMAVLCWLVVCWYQLHKRPKILPSVNLCLRSATGGLTRIGLF